MLNRMFTYSCFINVLAGKTRQILQMPPLFWSLSEVGISF